MSSRLVELPVREIELVDVLQIRARIDNDTIADYAEAMSSGAIFPPLTVFAENGSERYLLADGAHRLAAAKKVGMDTVACELRDGGMREALQYALSANDNHGLRRNNADKRRAVTTALKDPEWAEWSNVDIGRLCGVSGKLVARMRELLVLAGEINHQETVKIRQGGQTIERKATRGSESRTSARRGPKSQDEIDAERFFELLDHVRQCPYDGAVAAERYDAQRRHADVEFLHEFVGELLDAIEKGENGGGDEFIPF